MPHYPVPGKDAVLCISEVVIHAGAKNQQIVAEHTFDEPYCIEKFVMWELIEGGLSIVGAKADDREMFNFSEKNPSKVYTFGRQTLGNGLRDGELHPGEKFSLYIRNDIGKDVKIAVTAFGRILFKTDNATA